MRSFRFPRSASVLMVLIFVGILFAIDQGRQIQDLYPGGLRFPTDPAPMFGVFVLLGVLMFLIATAGYLVLCAFRQSGTQRFSNIRPHF
jgi:hypothetical protein